jgi:hypothetical protein
MRVCAKHGMYFVVFFIFMFFILCPFVNIFDGVSDDGA